MSAMSVLQPLVDLHLHDPTEIGTTNVDDDYFSSLVGSKTEPESSGFKYNPYRKNPDKIQKRPATRPTGKNARRARGCACSGGHTDPWGPGDVAKWQFWPNAMAMGSLTGKLFSQSFGAHCRKGPDREQKHNGFSYLAFDFQRDMLVMRSTFIINHTPLPPAFRPLDAELSFDDISSHGIHVVEKSLPGDTLSVVVTISCRRPPKFYCAFEQDTDLQRRSDGRDSPSGSQPYRRRATVMDFAIASVTELAAGVLKPIPEGACALPTYLNTFRWTFVFCPHQAAQFRACAHKLRLLSKDNPDMELLSKRPLTWTEGITHPTGNDHYVMPDLSYVDFSARAMIEGLVGNGILLPTNVPALLRALNEYALIPCFRDRILESLFTEDRIRDPEKLVIARAAFLRKTQIRNVDHVVMVRTVKITPTRVLVGPLQPEPGNSVTRRYKDKLDAIIRVQFTDEGDRLHILEYTKQADSLRNNVGLMARVRRALQHGIQVAGQRFYPVASSASQQKDHAMWFINTSVIDGLELRRWMGTVAETVVAKHAARMGLPFSASRIVPINITLGAELADIERGEHCFTDGCALAGADIMREAASALGITQGINATPSAIQFRLGGAKGVLSCWPKLIGSREVRLRPSQIKFRSQLKDLNVIRIAKYQVAFLNRQFIMIMSANGVPNELFIELFRDAVNNIKGMRERVRDEVTTKEDTRNMAIFTEFPLLRLIRAGFNNNPLVLDVCKLIECRALQDLKWRARLKLPGGVFLIGIADETGTLREGELFCQYQENETTPARVVQSEVLICRAPALHPGDVRRAQAVDRQELRHLKNVIVFSTQGVRGLPNMLGGGDLDGDDFTLIWDYRFVKPLSVYPPMDYTGPKAIRVDRVTQTHLNENFVQYILNDILGQVDNCHLALSDESSPFDSRCLELSEIHSTAVDFAKTGIAATLPPEISPKMWPDFMDKDPRKTRISEKILGKVFRIVGDEEPHYHPSDLRTLKYPHDDRISVYPIYNVLLEKLRPVKAMYENMMQYSMRRYRVHEAEVLAGTATQNKKRKRSRDLNHLNEPLKDIFACHVSTTREAALTIANSMHFPGKLSSAQVVARHAYALTYDRLEVEKWEKDTCSGVWGNYGEIEEREELRPKAMLTFAWVFCQELLELVQSV